MRSLVRSTAIRATFLAGIFTVSGPAGGPARTQELAPKGSGVSIHKIVIDSGSSRTVRYTVQGGSPRLQALVRRVEWAENELSLMDQLQGLKLDTVINDRRVAAFRTEQITNPYLYGPPGFYPPYHSHNRHATSLLQDALTGQLAYAATPQAALQLIGFLEQVQTQLDSELKALAPAEQKAAQVPLDALRQKIAALPKGDGPPAPPQPVLPPAVLPAALPAALPAVPLPVGPPPLAGTKATVEVRWGNAWFAAEVLSVHGGMTLIHYTGWSSSEWVPPGRIRRTGTASMTLFP